jgi:feruloyl-CoA synthase
VNIIEMIDRNARKFARKDGLRFEGSGISYAEIRTRGEGAAACLQNWGIQKGDRVAIMSRNTPAFVFAFFGAMKAGAVAAPINHKLTAAETAYILENSDARAFLFEGALGISTSALNADIPMAALDSPAGDDNIPQFEDLTGAAGSPTPVAVDDDDPAEILYTSGTTGKPKGCVLSHRGVVMAGITGALALKLDETDRMLMAMPIWHSSPLNNWFMGTCYVGGTTVLIREYHPLHFLEAVRNERCTVYFGAPISYLMPLQHVPHFDSFDLSSMRAWIYGGGPIGPQTVQTLIARYGSDQFYQVYGMTEAGPTGATLMPRDHAEKAGSIGNKGLPGADLVVMKTETEPAGPGETGEIRLKADSMMQGYHKNPEATAAAFSDGWYRTGDVARIDADGYLFIVDRMKDMIITGGENVYSKEVEDAIARHPDVAEAAVIGVPHPDWGETVTALVVPAKEASLTEAALGEFLSDKLARYKIPRSFRMVAELPHTPTGKVMKYKLREEWR